MIASSSPNIEFITEQSLNAGQDNVSRALRLPPNEVND